ncbi:uncharacterized protein N7498_009745 [Penicillium cinerascens]|uniref:Uncharacterized protein n=1 Tax=Penicillium cinerascens TaxID=70096 RepID=A0A9W9J5L6_9EURO|nr:uncharacterized protein N7498_009745 [Penicillium cinerascens]KAJ5190760.1 hypothetical protein N7498_009745 [Penicillium cinerascens]
MPVPTAELYDKEQANERQAGSAGHASLASTDTSSGRHLGTGTGGTISAPGSSSSQDESALSKEEADRLYEERMEEEYAKREGGA